MMSEANHTPLPWKQKHAHSRYWIQAKKIQVADVSAVEVDGEYDHVQTLSNAAFIIKACNSHEALVAACEAAVMTHIPGGSGAVLIPATVFAAIKQALQQARGET